MPFEMPIRSDHGRWGIGRELNCDGRGTRERRFRGRIDRSLNCHIGKRGDKNGRRGIAFGRETTRDCTVPGCEEIKKLSCKKILLSSD
jgi:hypothetical protein